MTGLPSELKLAIAEKLLAKPGTKRKTAKLKKTKK